MARGDIFTETRSAEVNMLPRSYIETMDRPTVLYILYNMVGAQQTNLLPKTASQNDAIFAQKVYRIYVTTSQYLNSYGCAITMVYIVIYHTYIIINTSSFAPCLVYFRCSTGANIPLANVYCCIIH